jgi:hypothetical protein
MPAHVSCLVVVWVRSNIVVLGDLVRWSYLIVPVVQAMYDGMYLLRFVTELIDRKHCDTMDLTGLEPVAFTVPWCCPSVGPEALCIKWTAPDSNRKFSACKAGVLPLDQQPASSPVGFEPDSPDPESGCRRHQHAGLRQTVHLGSPGVGRTGFEPA